MLEKVKSPKQIQSSDESEHSLGKIGSCLEHGVCPCRSAFIFCDLTGVDIDGTIERILPDALTEPLGFEAMTKTIHAVFENGIFRPVEPVDLPDKIEVEFEPRVVAKNAQWPDGYFEGTAGAFANEIFERPEQGVLPNRGLW